MESIVRVPADQMTTFTANLTRLNKKAARYGVTPVVITSTVAALYDVVQTTYAGDEKDIIETTRTKITNAANAKGYVIPVNEITISFDDIKVGDFTVIAKFERADGTKRNIVYRAVEDDAATPFITKHQDSAIFCDHCKTKRVRNVSFILRNDKSGEYVQIGKTCMKDYLGIDVTSALNMLEQFSAFVVSYDMDSWGDDFGSVNYYTPAECYIADLILLDNYIPFVSAATARDTGETCTADSVMFNGDAIIRELYNQSGFDTEQYEANRRAARDAAVAMMVEMRGDSSTDYARNVSIIVESGVIDRRTKQNRLVAGAVIHKLRAATAQRQREQSPSAHVGAVGDKIECELTFIRANWFETQFGPSCYATFEDVAGNQIVWKTGAISDEVCNNPNIKLVAKFTVKSHDEFNGVKQTYITRLKVLSILE